MNKEQCPICYTPLEVKVVAPCDDCGHFLEEIEHYKQGLHTYKIYDIYDGLRLQLCNFCAVDFGSYKSGYLGLKNGRRIGFEQFDFIKDVKGATLQKDKYCPSCNHRKTFLSFLSKLRDKQKIDSR
jgi:rubrerythrin